MIRVVIFAFLLVSSNFAFSQDSTYIVGEVGFRAGELRSHIERCNASPETLIEYEKSIGVMKTDSFGKYKSIDYIQVFDDAFEKGSKSLSPAVLADKSGCDEYLEKASEVIAHYGK